MDSSFKRRVLWAMAASTVVMSLTAVSARAESEELRLSRIAQTLKPISDDAWNEITGGKSADIYEVQNGDTLWDVSKRLFGNAFYWPKVWSLNNEIRNPHVITPGQRLSFIPGTSESTPRLSPTAIAQNDTGGGSAPEEPTDSGASTGRPEYEKIPADWWAPVDNSQELSKKYDEWGLDKNLKIEFTKRFTFRVPSIVNDRTIPFLGEIVGSRREGVGLTQHETVFLRSNTQDLQVGTTYSILIDPNFVRERRSDRNAYVYKASGEVRIVGVKDELYVGVITKAYDVIRRGDRVYPLLPLITGIQPLAATAALEALVIDTQGTDNTAQFRFVHLDRGLEDGVQIGNVFRIYDYYDPATREKLTDADFLIHADAIVVHATAQFATAMVINSRGTFARGDFGVLMTDVSEFERQNQAIPRDFAVDENGNKSALDRELDELDALDRATGEGLGKKEEMEIKELEHWDRTKDMQYSPSEEPTLPSTPDVPTDQAEQYPGVDPIEPLPPQQEPTLDETLDSPMVTPGIETPAPPTDVPPQEDTLDIPPIEDISGEPFQPVESMEEVSTEEPTLE